MSQPPHPHAHIKHFQVNDQTPTAQNHFHHLQPRIDVFQIESATDTFAVQIELTKIVKDLKLLIQSCHRLDPEPETQFLTYSFTGKELDDDALVLRDFVTGELERHDGDRLIVLQIVEVDDAKDAGVDVVRQESGVEEGGVEAQTHR